MDTFSTLGLHYFCCSFMTGLIWIIQVIHYPSFKFLDRDRFSEFEKFHIKRLSSLVAPVMLVELGSGVALFYFWKEAYFWPMLFNIILLVIIWLVTLFLTRPYHVKLLRRFDLNLLHKLIRINWARTILWSIRCIILGLFVF
ncbi:MAG: hypothetical protein E2O68_00385 [Deltaproteobacteria bacterium]|nr:MAG: hypothetical protein E2O68_00385 [Deltaproteobacteria bacterium]